MLHLCRRVAGLSSELALNDLLSPQESLSSYILQGLLDRRRHIAVRQVRKLQQRASWFGPRLEPLDTSLDEAVLLCSLGKYMLLLHHLLVELLTQLVAAYADHETAVVRAVWEHFETLKASKFGPATVPIPT